MDNNPFLDALINDYEYECNGKTIKLTTEETSHENGKYFCVVCDKCCNIPVLHLLRKKKIM